MYFIIAQFACDDNPKSQPDSSGDAAHPKGSARFGRRTAHPKAGAWFRRRAQPKAATWFRRRAQPKADASSRTSRRAHPKASAWFRRRAQPKAATWFRRRAQPKAATWFRRRAQPKAGASSRTSRRASETSEPHLRPQRRELCPSVCIFNPVKPDQVAGVHPPHGSGAARNPKPTQAPGHRVAHPKRPNRIYARSGESFVLPFAYSTR